MFVKTIITVWFGLLIITIPLHASFSFKEMISYVNPKKQEDILTYEHHLDIDGSLYAETTQGTIAIKTWNHKKIVVEVIKRGSEKDLESLRMTTTFKNDEARIIAKQKNKKRGRVDLNIIVPRQTILTLNVTNGAIHVCQAHGPVNAIAKKGPISLIESVDVIHAITNQGNIFIKQKKFQEPTTITAHADQGNITLELPLSTHANLNVHTLNGKLTSNLYVTPSQQHTKLDTKYWNRIKREFVGTLGDGGSLIKVATKSGNIKITDY